MSGALGERAWLTAEDVRRAVRAGAAALVATCVAMVAVTARGAVDRGQATAWRVDVNTADEATLRLLPGIGPGLAARIVEDRAQRGPFATLSELENVPGIGERRVKAIEPYARAGRAPATGRTRSAED